jgi:hypothetical protein
MLFHDDAALLLPAEAEVCVDVEEESRRWSFAVVDDEDGGGGHAYARSRFDKANTACGRGWVLGVSIGVVELPCLVPNNIGLLDI